MSRFPGLLERYIACGHVVSGRNLNNYRTLEPVSKITYLGHRNSADESTERKKVLNFSPVRLTEFTEDSCLLRCFAVQGR